MHLRPATEFARLSLASGCRVKVTVVADGGGTADGSSVLELAMLGVSQGTTLRISAEGPEAESAVRGLVELVSAGFCEAER
jgi:phosphotransferase system HPr (HPr) family protein